MLLQQKRRAVRIAAGLLVGRECGDQIVRRDEAFPPQADQRLEQRGVTVLHVDRAPAVEPAVLFGQLERIDRPVFALGIDDVEVPEEQHRRAA